MPSFSLFISKRIANSGSSEASFVSSISRMAVVSIAIGVAIMLLSILILEGFKDTIRDKIYSFTGHLEVSKYSLRNSLDDHMSLRNDLYGNQDTLDIITRIEPFAIKAGLLKTKDDIQGVILKGQDQNFDTLAFQPNLVAGNMPKFYGKASKYADEILISSTLAKLLRLNISDKVFIYFAQDPPRRRELKITGIFETGMEEFDSKMLICDIGMVRRLNSWSDETVSGMQVFIKDPKAISAAYDRIFDIIGYDLSVVTTARKYSEIFDWLNLLNRNVVILLTLILAIAIFNMVSILLILIMERTKMIGILMALGASTGKIKEIFAYQGMILTIKGIGFGNLIGLGCCALQYYFHIIPLDQKSYYMDYVPVSWPWLYIILINLVAFVFISAALLIPAMTISRVNPVRAIRFD